MVIPLPSPTTTAGAISRATLRAGPVFTRCGVTRRLFGTTKLRFSRLASRKNRRRRGRARNSNRPRSPTMASQGHPPAIELRRPPLCGLRIFSLHHEPTMTATEQLSNLDRILAHGDITTLFQPIVSLSQRRALGHEALTRGPSNSALHS